MNLEERLKEKFLNPKSKNIFKYIYYFFQKIKKERYVRKSYSGGAIDLIVDYYFKDKKKGVYVDVGAYHPFSGSNTYKLFSRGWSGINLDLDQQTIDAFNFFRPNDENICAAVSNNNESGFKCCDGFVFIVSIINYYFKNYNFLNSDDY